MNSLETIKTVTDEMVRRGYDATMEYPGIEIRKYGLVFDFDTDNETWEADIDAEVFGGFVSTDVPSDSTDVMRIADAVAAAIESCGPGEEIAAGSGGPLGEEECNREGDARS